MTAHLYTAEICRLDFFASFGFYPSAESKVFAVWRDVIESSIETGRQNSVTRVSFDIGEVIGTCPSGIFKQVVDSFIKKSKIYETS